MLVGSSSTVAVDPTSDCPTLRGCHWLTHVDGAKIVNSDNYCVISTHRYIDVMFQIEHCCCRDYGLIHSCQPPARYFIDNGIFHRQKYFNEAKPTFEFNCSVFII